MGRKKTPYSSERMEAQRRTLLLRETINIPLMQLRGFYLLIRQLGEEYRYHCVRLDEEVPSGWRKVAKIQKVGGEWKASACPSCPERLREWVERMMEFYPFAPIGSKRPYARITQREGKEESNGSGK